MNERKTALVTGGATRLGRHFALALAESGFDIALHYSTSQAAAEDTRDRIIGLGRRCNLYQETFTPGRDPSDLITRVMAEYSAIDVLLNSASAYRPATTAETDQGLLEEQFAVNLFAPYLLTSAFAAAGNRGNVINILDNKIACHQYHYSAYLLAKKSLMEFTRLAALEFAPGIRVNGIAPGVILPGEKRTDDYINWRIQGIPLAKQGTPEHLISAMRYILDNGFVTGQILFVDGGEGVNQIGRNSETYPGK